MVKRIFQTKLMCIISTIENFLDEIYINESHLKQFNCIFKDFEMYYKFSNIFMNSAKNNPSFLSKKNLRDNLVVNC